MKKILFILIALPLILVGAYLNHRYDKNHSSVIPYPFIFTQDAYTALIVDSPILIIGDRMGERLASFKTRLSEKLSINLSKPIEISSLAHEGDNIHRTLQKIRSLPKVPLIVIYLGNYDQSYESTFNTTNLPIILKNFSFYKNDYLKTAMMIWPSLSRFLYYPISYINLGPNITKDPIIYEDLDFQNRTSFQYTLYEEGLDELFQYISKNNALILSLTTPINLDIKPQKSCYGSVISNAKEDIEKVNKLINEQDYKAAFNVAEELVLLNPSNAMIHFQFSQILKKLNRFSLAQKHGELAKAYDCQNRGANPIYNVILKRLSTKYQYEFLDFHQLLVDESQFNYVFLDEIYPQDFYMEKVIDALALKIKKRLKL